MRKFLLMALIAALMLSCVGAAALTYQRDYFKDDYADQLKEIQQRLIDLSYLSGGADGWFGAKTQSAIKRFQTVNKLEVTGVADFALQEALFSDDAVKSPRVLMTVAKLKQIMTGSTLLGVTYDMSALEDTGEGASVELNNYVTLHADLVGDEVTELQLIGKKNVTIPFTMLLMALDSSIDKSNMYDAVDMLAQEGERHVDGMTIRYVEEDNGTLRLIVVPMEEGEAEQ